MEAKQLLFHFLIPTLLLTACSQSPISEVSSKANVELKDGDVFVNGIVIGAWEQTDSFDVMGTEIKLLTQPDEFECGDDFYLSHKQRVYYFQLGGYGFDHWFTPNDYFPLTNPSPITEVSFAHVGDCYFKNSESIIYEGKIVSEADMATFESLDQTYAFARDKEKVYLAGQPVDGDPKTYKVLKDWYAKDATAVYHDGKLIPEADPKTFEVLDRFYTKDEKNVYYYDLEKEVTEVIPEADPLTFKLMPDSIFAQDKNFVYYYQKPMADAASFEIIQQNGEDSSYAKDKNNVYHLNAGLDLIPGLQPATFKVLTEGYATDGIKVIYSNRELIGADAKSFEVIPTDKVHNSLGKDSQSIYFTDKKIEGSDGPTFEWVAEEKMGDFELYDNIIFKDKNTVYVNGESININDVDVKTVKKLPYGLLMDAKAVYCKPDKVLAWTVVEDADPNSLEILPSGFYRDKEDVYIYCYKDVLNQYGNVSPSFKL